MEKSGPVFSSFLFLTYQLAWVRQGFQTRIIPFFERSCKWMLSAEGLTKWLKSFHFQRTCHHEGILMEENYVFLFLSWTLQTSRILFSAPCGPIASYQSYVHVPLCVTGIPILTTSTGMSLHNCARYKYPNMVKIRTESRLLRAPSCRHLTSPIGNAQSRATFFRHSAVLSLLAVLLLKGCD